MIAIAISFMRARLTRRINGGVSNVVPSLANPLTYIVAVIRKNKPRNARLFASLHLLVKLKQQCALEFFGVEHIVFPTEARAFTPCDAQPG